MLWTGLPLASLTGTYDKHVNTIGEVTINFTALESALAFLVSELIGVDSQIGRAITSELSFKQLVHICGSLYRLKSNDVAKIGELDNLLKRAFTVEQKRNIIIHSQWDWSHDPEFIKRTKHTAKRELKSTAETMSADDIQNIVHEIFQLTRIFCGSGHTPGPNRGYWRNELPKRCR